MSQQSGISVELCIKCNGSRHTYNEETGRWRKCECLIDSIKMRRYMSSGVPPHIARLSTSSFKNSYLLSGDDTSVGQIVNGRINKLRCVCSSPDHDVLIDIGDYAVKIACDFGVSAKLVTIDDLVDLEFDRSSVSRDIYQYGFVAIRAGMEPEHKWNSVIFERMLMKRVRWGMPFIVLAEHSIDRLDRQYRSKYISDVLQNVLPRIYVRGVDV